MSASTTIAPVGRGSAWKIVASVVVISGAVGLMLRSSMKEGAQYYRHVDEVMANPNAFRGKHLQVHGHVVDGSIEQARGTLQYRFKIESREPRGHAVMSAGYTGLVPDTFKSGAEVVATGMITAEDKLDVAPDGIMAKCPSKYEAGGAPKPSVLQGANGPSSPGATPGAAPTTTALQQRP